MLKKLRWRIIAVAMAAFFAVTVLIVALINVTNYYTVVRQADETLDSLLRFEAGRNEPAKESDAPAPEFPNQPDQEFRYMTRFFTVRTDADGRIQTPLMQYIASVDRKTAAAYAQRAQNRRQDRGFLDSYRYLKDTGENGTVIVFLNVSREQKFMGSLLTVSLLIAFSGMLLIFLLVFLLSKKAIKPFVQNLEQQKRFITDASHELKTPLTSIGTSLDIVTLEHGDDEWTDNIRTQTKRLSKIVGELVTLSRLDEANPLPNKETFSLSDAAWEIVESFQSHARTQEKSIAPEIAADVTLHGERTAIVELLSVLIDNAIRYSTPKAVVRFSLEKKGGRIHICVQNPCNYDTPPDCKRLFDRFYRPDESRSRESGGTGVGLSIAKAVAEAHGGKISASCPDGREMRIHVVL